MEVATASAYPSYSQLSQGTPTSSRPLLPSVPAQLTTSQHLSVGFTSTSTSMISEKIQLLGKHPANTQDETSSRKHQRISYTSDTPPVVWKPPTSYSQPSQVTPTSSGPLLSLVPAQQTISQFATKFPRYPSSSSYNITPQGMSPIPASGSVTTPPDLSLPVTTHTLGSISFLQVLPLTLLPSLVTQLLPRHLPVHNL